MQVLLYLKIPAALPNMLAGLRIAGGLSLIGAVVAEIAAGSAGAGSGLAFRIAEIRLSAEHPAHVRSSIALIDNRYRDLSSAFGAFAFHAAPLAQRRQQRKLIRQPTKLHRDPECGHYGNDLDQSRCSPKASTAAITASAGFEIKCQRIEGIPAQHRCAFP